jgi:hypothetical protein
MRMMKTGWYGSRALSLVVVPLFVGCDDATGPTPAELQGAYEASVLTIQYPDRAEDGLLGGGSIELVLLPNGLTEGELFLPGGGEAGTDLRASLSGSWSLSGGIVRLEHAADTFLRDVELGVVGNRLLGQGDFGDFMIFVIFDRVAST